MGELEHVDHLVLLGDSIELRDGPLADALASAAPFFDDLGRSLAGRRVTIVAGNHDHQLAWPWLERRAEQAAGPLGLEHLSRPCPGDPLARLARSMPAVELVLAYPGLRVRPDIYATHGHYLDCHNQVATFECLARAVSERLIARGHRGYRTPDDYELVLAPVYRAIYRLAQSRRVPRLAVAAKALVRAWENAAGYRGHQGFTSRGGARRRPGVGAMAQVVDRLGIEARYVIFGHLHRPGPLGGDAQGWMTRSETQLVNTGSWLHEPAYLGATAAESPNWPGTYVLVREEGPPELHQVLYGVTREQLRSQMP